MRQKMDEQVSFADLGLWSGKTYPEPLAAEARKERILRQSSKKSSGSQNRKPLCLCVYRTEDGQNPGAITLKMVPGALLGEYTTRSFGESPSEENASRLSQILEDCAHPKYSLSAKACRGILNRAERRGKELPEQLRIALEAQSTESTSRAEKEMQATPSECHRPLQETVMEPHTPSHSKSEPENLGGGKGILIQHERTGALGTLNNQAVAFSQNQRDEVRDLNDVAGALAAKPGMKQQTFVFENHSQDSRYNPIGDVCETVSAKYGTGGNNMPMVVEPLCVGNGQLNNMSMAKQANTLDTMHDQQAVLVSAVDCRNGKENGEINGTLQAKSNGGTSVNLQNICRVRNVVRRLTPLECERLQGMPDDWSRYGINEKGEVYELSDSARYRLQGNGIATPFWRWMLKRISVQYERTPTLGSLFDGQATFPLLWEGINGKGTALWTSEIEKHAAAVAKYHFPLSEYRRCP